MFRSICTNFGKKKNINIYLIVVSFAKIGAVKKKNTNTLERKYMSVRTNHIYWRSAWNLVRGICKVCGRANVKSGPIATEKAARSLQASIKLHLHLYRDTIWHPRNKERLGDICMLSHKVHNPVYCLNKYDSSIYTDYTTLYWKTEKRVKILLKLTKRR